MPVTNGVKTDAVYNFDDMYSESNKHFGFLSQYANEQFVSRQVRKARITYGPDTDATNVTAGVEYLLGSIPARAILLSVYTIVTVDTAEVGVATFKAGADTIHTAPTETAGYSTTAVTNALAFNLEEREVYVSFDADITENAGSITVVYEYVDAELIEGPFGS